MRKIALALSAFLLSFTPALADPIKVDGGLVDGKDLGSGVTGWFGVPFAAPPVRDLRWRAPQPVQPWQGIYHADRFAPMCLQSLRSRTMNHYFGNEATSEDCLYLNVWAPKDAVASGKKLPVMVWIYGGGFGVGSASMANYSGEHMAREGVVYVALSYRLGPLGFLAHPDLTAEGKGHSGNYGFMDQVAALEWVQRNVAGFGGDPANVTVLGQSAGSMSISLLQINPHAKGLFSRLVGMSGSVHGELISPVPLAKGEEQGLALQKALGASSIETMRDIAGDRILQVANSVQRSPVVIDGDTVTGMPAEVFAAHKQADVPVLVGFTRDERFANLGPATTVAEYQAAIRKTFPKTAEDILKAYPAASDAEVGRAIVDVMRDMSVGSQMFNWATANVTYGKAPAYGYFFTRRQPYVPGITFLDHNPATAGAYHTGEVPYFLRNLESMNLFRKTRDWTPLDYRLSDTMSGLILNFAKTGRPAADYPAFDPKAAKVMTLGDETKYIAWPNAKALPLLASPVPAAPQAPAPGAAPRVRD